MLAGVGTAGIPAGSLPFVAMVLGIVGTPPEGPGLILGVDRLLDGGVTKVAAISACAACAGGSCSEPPPFLATMRSVMRKLAAAVAVGFAALTANVALACDEKERAEQANQKPAVAEKTQKETKPQQKAKKADKSAEKAAVARADKE